LAFIIRSFEKACYVARIQCKADRQKRFISCYTPMIDNNAKSLDEISSSKYPIRRRPNLGMFTAFDSGERGKAQP
jgi:hypothetical protein